MERINNQEVEALEDIWSITRWWWLQMVESPWSEVAEGKRLTNDTHTDWRLSSPLMMIVWHSSLWATFQVSQNEVKQKNTLKCHWESIEPIDYHRVCVCVWWMMLILLPTKKDKTSRNRAHDRRRMERSGKEKYNRTPIVTDERLWWPLVTSVRNQARTSLSLSLWAHWGRGREAHSTTMLTSPRMFAPQRDEETQRRGEGGRRMTQSNLESIHKSFQNHPRKKCRTD